MITKEVFSFLNELKENNDRDWFNDNKKRFQKLKTEAEKSFKNLFNELNKIDQVDSYKMFRIYRDVRFSADKLPYKTHFSCSFHRQKPELRGGYYLHIEPSNSFIATGFWDPSKEDLFRIRKEFEFDDAPIRKILQDGKLLSMWGNMQGDELKSSPRDFDSNHPAIDLIRKKQFIFIKKFTDKEVLDDNFETIVLQHFEAIRPYFDYMSEILTTNLNGESII